MQKGLHMNKETKLSTAYKVIESVISDENNLIANLANISAVIKSEFDYHWVGFYLVDDDSKELVLGPFQGPLACTRIPYGKGVCGTSWAEAKTLIVADVHKFPGHIACSALSNSEIVVPIINDGKVVAVLDIDSTNFNDFESIDQVGFEKICAFVAEKFKIL